MKKLFISLIIFFASFLSMGFINNVEAAYLNFDLQTDFENFKQNFFVELENRIEYQKTVSSLFTQFEDYKIEISRVGTNIYSYNIMFSNDNPIYYKNYFYDSSNDLARTRLLTENAITTTIFIEKCTYNIVTNTCTWSTVSTEEKSFSANEIITSNLITDSTTFNDFSILNIAPVGDYEYVGGNIFLYDSTTEILLKPALDFENYNYNLSWNDTKIVMQNEYIFSYKQIMTPSIESLMESSSDDYQKWVFIFSILDNEKYNYYYKEEYAEEWTQLILEESNNFFYTFFYNTTLIVKIEDKENNYITSSSVTVADLIVGNAINYEFKGNLNGLIDLYIYMPTGQTYIKWENLTTDTEGHSGQYDLLYILEDLGFNEQIKLYLYSSDNYMWRNVEPIQTLILTTPKEQLIPLTPYITIDQGNILDGQIRYTIKFNNVLGYSDLTCKQTNVYTDEIIIIDCFDEIWAIDTDVQENFNYIYTIERNSIILDKESIFNTTGLGVPQILFTNQTILTTYYLYMDLLTYDITNDTIEYSIDNKNTWLNLANASLELIDIQKWHYKYTFSFYEKTDLIVRIFDDNEQKYFYYTYQINFTNKYSVIVGNIFDNFFANLNIPNEFYLNLKSFVSMFYRHQIGNLINIIFVIGIILLLTRIFKKH